MGSRGLVLTAWVVVILWVVLSPAKGKTDEFLEKEKELGIDNTDPYKIQKYPRQESLEPVIFEPLRNIKLSRATYKVTSYLNFKPYMDNFVKFHQYLERFLLDLKSPDRMGDLVKRPKTLASNYTQGACNTYQSSYVSLTCRFQQQYYKLQEEAESLGNLYDTVFHKFLTAIDHLDYDPPKEENNQQIAHRVKRYVDQYKFKGQYEDMSDEELELVEKVLDKIRELHPELHKKLDREKRFSIFTWLIGWGTYRNAKNIAKLKKNVKILQEQNILQDKQIREVAHYLNLTMIQAEEQQGAIHELDERMLLINKTLWKTIGLVTVYLQHTAAISMDARATLSRLNIAILGLKQNVEAVYEYMRVMASHLINPVLLPPDKLRKVLSDVQEYMRQNPRLELPYDPVKDIWSFYSVMRVTPVVVEDFLFIILTIPMLDKALQMDVYKVHNLPSLHPEHQVQFTYELEGEYLAIGKHGLYAAIPTSDDIRLCLTTDGGLCMINQALYPVDKIEWCLYALFINDKEKIRKQCTVRTDRRHANLAVSLGGYMWAVSSLAGETIRVRCLIDTAATDIKPPLTLVEIGNGCEGYSTTINIPAKSELTSVHDAPGRVEYFQSFNYEYQNMSNYGIFQELNSITLTKEEKETLGIRLSKLPPFKLEHLAEKIKLIDEKYPWSIPPNYLLAILIVMFLIWIVAIVYIVCRLYMMRTRGGLMGGVYKFLKGETMGPEINGLRDQLMHLLLPRILDNLPMQGRRLPSTPGGSRTPTTLPRSSLHSLPSLQKTRPSQESIELALHDLSGAGVDVHRYFQKSTSSMAE